MTTLTTAAPRETAPQHLVALAKANRVRLAAATAKRDMKAGRLTLAAALEDERAQSMTVFDLLLAQPHWGRRRSIVALEALRRELRCALSEQRRVEDLTARQRAALAGLH